MNHQDCRNYIPIDVEKGLCGVAGIQVPAGAPCCSKLVQLPKCKNCGNFKDLKADGMGRCEGLKDSYWAYAELRGTQCEGYKLRS